jgi:hypothetical protein
MNKKLILFVVSLAISSCSFHSSQYDFVKDFVNKKDNPLLPKKNWVITWIDERINLYAINTGDQIIFVDSEINIFFKDKQIYKVIGLFPEKKILEISFDDNGLIYTLDNKQISSDICEERKVSIFDDQSKVYSQICHQKETRNSYENEIKMNRENLITNLKFKIHPRYPSLELSMK